MCFEAFTKFVGVTFDLPFALFLVFSMRTVRIVCINYLTLRNTEPLGSNQDKFRQSILYMTQGCLPWRWWGGGCQVTPDFGRSVNPMYLNQDSGRAYYAHHVTTDTHRFSDFPTALWLVYGDAGTGREGWGATGPRPYLADHLSLFRAAMIDFWQSRTLIH